MAGFLIELMEAIIFLWRTAPFLWVDAIQWVLLMKNIAQESRCLALLFQFLPKGLENAILKQAEIKRGK